MRHLGRRLFRKLGPGSDPERGLQSVGFSGVLVGEKRSICRSYSSASLTAQTGNRALAPSIEQPAARETNRLRCGTLRNPAPAAVIA
jgi:hypothetical protein